MQIKRKNQIFTNVFCAALLFGIMSYVIVDCISKTKDDTKIKFVEESQLEVNAKSTEIDMTNRDATESKTFNPMKLEKTDEPYINSKRRYNKKSKTSDAVSGSIAF